MGSLGKLEIHLENSNDGIFQAGQTVFGKLVVTVWKSLKIQGIEFKIRGQCRAEWHEGFGEQEQQLYETEDYIRHVIILFGKVPNLETPHVELLESGKHVFHCKFDLPADIPSSFEGSHGYVRYWVKAKIHGVLGLLDQSGKVEFGVERSLDLNTVPRALFVSSTCDITQYNSCLPQLAEQEESAEDEDSCVLCGGCLGQGTISASFRINRRGFVSGESIICDAEVYNGSVSSIKNTEITFYKLITYGDDPYLSKSREKQTICEQFRGKIKSGCDDIYDKETLTLPSSLPATSLPGCSLIDIDYVVECNVLMINEVQMWPLTTYILRVYCPKQKINMKLPLLIIVGTVPLKEAPPTNYCRPIRDIVANSNDIPAPITLQQPFSDSVLPSDLSSPWLQENNDMTTLMDRYEMSSSSNVPPMATELNERYPPIAEVSIGQRERTLANIYGDSRRPRLRRIMSAVNEGAELEHEDSVL